MAKLVINTGTTPNDGTGDSLLSGATKVNDNFNELYTALGDGTDLTGIVTSLVAGSNITLSASSGVVTITSSASGEVVDDTTPQLGGNLDLNSKDITGTGNVNITGVITATSFSGTVPSSSLSGALPALDGSALTGVGGGSTAEVRANTLTVSGVSTLGVTSVGILSAISLSVTGVTTLGITTASSLIVTGVTTIGDLITMDGNLGIVTANEFHGDGYYLTGVNSEGLVTGGLTVTGISTLNDDVQVLYGKDIVLGQVGSSGGKIQLYTGDTETDDIFEIDPTIVDDITIRHSGTNARYLIVNTTGKIGINSSTPSAELDIIANTKIAGVVTATKFVGDGSGLSGVTGSGSGVVVKHDGSLIGTAGTINFSTNLDVTAITAGVVTVTAAGGGSTPVGTGGTWANYDGVTGVTTTKKVKIQNNLEVTGVVTATTFLGGLTGNVTGNVTGNADTATTATNLADAANITTGTIADARFPATLPAASAANLTSIPAANITGTLPAINGGNVTDLNASNLASGTVPDARFPSILPAVGGQSLTGVTTDVEFAGLQAQVNTLANNLNIIGFYNATSGIVTSLTVIGESRSYISAGATLPNSGIHTGDYLIVSTNGEDVGIATFLSVGVNTAYSGDWIVGADSTTWEVLSYSSAVVAPRATSADFADTLKSTSSVNTSGIITAASFTGDGTNLTGVASTDYIVTGTAATFNNVAVFNDNLRIADSVKAQFGTGFDLEIYHDGSNSYISDVGTGALRVGYGGTTELYTGTSKKLETIGTGVTVTGTMFATQFSGGGLMAERTTVSGVTTAIGNNGIGNTDITGFKSYALMKVGLSTAGWFRLYTDSTSRTNDASRSVGIDPSPGSGVIAEVVTTGVSTSHIITPFVTGGNMDDPVTTTMYASVQNLSGVTTEISVNLTLLQLEA